MFQVAFFIPFFIKYFTVFDDAFDSLNPVLIHLLSGSLIIQSPRLPEKLYNSILLIFL